MPILYSPEKSDLPCFKSRFELIFSTFDGNHLNFVRRSNQVVVNFNTILYINIWQRSKQMKKDYRASQLSQFNSKHLLWLVLGLMAVTVLSGGCSHTEKVTIPPRMDLRSYGTVGIIDFDTGTDQELRQHVTQEFIQTLYAAQPGVRVLELGPEAPLLKKVGQPRLDPASIRAIGEVYRVDVLIHGKMMVSEPKPNVRLSSTWQAMQVAADVEASLLTKIWETNSGATLWTKSSRRKESVANLKADTGGNFDFGAVDPAETHGKLVPNLVYANTSDFRSQYEYRRVK
jgi:hypothetical protein